MRENCIFCPCIFVDFRNSSERFQKVFRKIICWRVVVSLALQKIIRRTYYDKETLDFGIRVGDDAL